MTPRPRYRTTPNVLDVEERTPSAGARLPNGWVHQVAQLVRDTYTAADVFTLADLRDAGVSEPPHAAHWGALIRHLHARDVIRPAGLTLRTASDGCTRPTRLWSLVTSEGGPAAP